MKKLFLPIILILAAGLIGGYAYLGGFNKPILSEGTTQKLLIAGKYYEGPIKSESFGELFKLAAVNVENGIISGDMGGIYYNNPEEKNDNIKAFVGVFIADSTIALPAGYKLRTVAAGQKVVQASIDAHYMLAANKLYPEIFDYAKKNNIKLQDFFIERYPSTHKAIVQVPVLKTNK